MKRIGWILIVNIVVFGLWITGSQGTLFRKNYDINLTVESDVTKDMIKEVKKAVEVFPAEVLEAFTNDAWKIVMLSSFNDNEQYEHISSDPSVVGLINFEQRTITIKGVPEFESSIYQITVHELCHFVDRLYGNVSQAPKFSALYEKYKDGKYVTYSYSGVAITEKYESDILYATSSVYEFFAESYKDYLLHTEYLKSNYKDIYDYYRLYFKGEKNE